MPNVIYPGQNNNGSYLTNRIGSPTTVSETLDSNEMIRRATQDAAQQVFNTKYDEATGETFGGRVMRYGASGVIDTVDTVASVLPSIERGDVWESAREVGMSGLADWQARNKSGVEMTSAVLTGLAGGYVAEGLIMGAMGARVLVAAGLNQNKLVVAASQFLPKARDTARLAEMGAAEVGATASIWSPGMRGLMTSTAMKNMGKAAVGEAIIGFAGQNNEAMWSESASQNAFWIGLGIALPGGLGLIQGRAELRAIANEAGILEARRAALDPHAIRTARDTMADPSVPMNPEWQVMESAQITSYALGWKAKFPAGAPDELQGRLSAIVTQEADEMNSALAKFGAKGIPFSGPSRTINFAKTGDTAARDHIVDSLHDDPTLLMEAVSIGTGNPKGVIQSRKDAIDNLLKANDPAAFKQARELQKEQPMILINGHLHPATDEAMEFAGFDQTKLKLGSTGAPFEYKVELPSGKSKAIILNPATKVGNYTKLPIQDRLGVIQAFKKLSATMLSTPKGKQPGVALNANSDWLQMEFAAYHKNRGGDVNISKLGVSTDEELRFLTLKKKIEAMKADGVYGHYLNAWDRLKYNLPAPTSLERIEDGSSRALYSVLDSISAGKVNSYSDAKSMYNDMLERSELAGIVRGKEKELYGEMFDFNFSKQNKWYEPVIIYYKQTEMDIAKRGTKAAMTDALTQNKLVVYHTLADKPDPNSLVQSVVRNIHTTPEGAKTINIGGWSDSQMTGMGDSWQAEVGALLPVAHTARDMDQMLGTYRLVQQNEDLSMMQTKRMIDDMGDLPHTITSSANKKSSILFDAFTTMRPGWDTNGNWIQDAKGFWSVELAETKHNFKRLNDMGLTYTKGMPLPNHMTGAPLVLDDLGKQLFDRVRSALDIQFKDENRLRVAMGLSPLRKTPDFLPAESTKNKFVAFVLDSKGDVVSGKTIIEDTADKFAQRRADTYKNLKAGEYLHARQDIEHAQDVYDQAQQYWVDPSFVGRLDRANKGGLAGNIVRNDTVRELLRYIQDKNLHLANSTTRIVLDDQIKFAKMRRTVEQGQQGSRSLFAATAARFGNQTPPRTVWDAYLKAVAGPVIGDVKDRRITQLVGKVEPLIQVAINSTWAGMNALPVEQVSNWVKDMATRMGVPGGIVSRTAEFDKLTTELGAYMPYATMDKYLEQRIIKGKRPIEVRELASKLNKWDATWRLRYLEIPNAAMNMLGIINNMPSILGNSNTPVLGQLVNGNGKKVGIVDAMRVIMQGTRETISRAHTKDWDYAQSRGALDQGVAEVRNMYSAIEDQSSTARFLKGDKTIKNAKVGTRDWLKYHGIDGMLSLANDSTEKWSRMWAHGIGLKLADLRGISDTAERFNFANSIADQAIANYSPLNRGEIYHTALGSMMGLYQTYAMTYSNRMYRWAEKGDYTAIMRQVATQSALFGISSNVGYNQFEWLEDKATRDEATISDMIYARFGPEVGSLIAHGGIADLPKLMGADTGIAIYNRADSNIRSNVLQDGLTIDPVKAAAALGTVKQVATGVLSVANQLWSGNSITSGQRISETLAAALPNRMLRGSMTVMLNDGNDIDQFGNIMTSSKGLFESLVRASGLKTTRQQDEIDFKYRNRASLDRQAALMEQLRLDTKALMRDGQLNARITEIWDKYTANGGNPVMFKPWVRQTWEAATTTRSQKELMDSLNSTRFQARAAREGWVD